MTRNQSLVSAIVGVILALVVVLQGFGVNIPVVDETQLTAAVTSIITVAVWAFQLWKNHNFTDAAVEGQKVINAIKAEEYAEEEIEEAEAAVENAKHAKEAVED